MEKRTKTKKAIKIQNKIGNFNRKR